MKRSTLFSKTILNCFLILSFPVAASAQVTFFKETIGNYTAGSGTISAALYTGWSNGATYIHTVPTGTANVTGTVIPSDYAGASGGTPIKVNRSSSWVISGINTSNYIGITLSFGIHKSNSSHAGANMVIEVSTDGVVYTPLTWTALPTGGGTGDTWYYRTGGTDVTGVIPSTANLRIRFRNANSTFIAYDFDDIELKGSSNLLPLSFIDFKSIQNNGSTSFTWTTRDEETVETYELQRSNNGNEFVTVSKLNAAKNNHQQSYNAKDVQPVQKQAYYRIKAVTKDGKSTFSKTIMVNGVKANNNDLKITATRNELAISSNNNSAQRITYSVVNFEGMVLQHGNVQLANSNAAKASLSSLKPGVYVVLINNDNIKQSHKIYIP